MDLREKPGKMQLLGEYSVRFRLILLLIMVPLWVVFSAQWSDFIALVLDSAQVNSSMIDDLIQRQVPLKSIVLGPMFIVLLLFLVRGNFFGWRQGLIWLGSVFSLFLLVSTLEGAEPYIAFVVMAIGVVAVTLLFFVRNLYGIVLFPLLILLYGLSTGLMIWPVSSVGWQGTMALLLADSVALLGVVRADLRAGRPVAGAVSGCLRQYYPMILASSLAVAVAEGFFMYMDVPLVLGKDWPQSLAVILSYALWFPMVYIPVLSWAPLGRLRAKQRSFQSRS